MSAYKRSIIIAGLAALGSLGWTSDGLAQSRYVHGPSRVVVVPTYVSPFWYYDPWFALDYQWGPYGPYGYGYPYRRYADAGAAVKLEVKPKQAEVYVDGYYAGIVDDFDGAFQRLRLPPGEHEIELYLDGYRAVHQKIYLTPDNTFKLKYELQKLAPGDQAEPRPNPPSPPPNARPNGPRRPQGAPPDYPPPPNYPPAGRRGPQDRMPPPPPPPSANAPSASGTLSVRVQPGDADISVDGERWHAPDGQERVLIDVGEGRHTVEIRKSGYRTYVTEVDVKRGETTTLNVSLRSQDQL